MLYDTHTHLAPYSHDASQTVGELLAAAGAQGLAAVCTADHYEKDLFYIAGQEDIFEPAGYFHDLLPIQAEQAPGAVRLLLGAELGYLPHLVEHLAGFAATWPFDEIILSLHILDGVDPFISPEIYLPGKLEVYGRYLRQMARMCCECPDFDILGHFDYFSRYAPYPDRKMYYAELPDDFDCLLVTLVEMDKALEINTRTVTKLLSVGYRGSEIWPDPLIIHRYLDLGGRLISLGSDGHHTGSAGKLIREGAAWLQSLGCMEQVHYEQRRALVSSL
jgi:histidinol-phosphatase (PHP family)